MALLPPNDWPARIYFTDSSTRWNETTGSGCILEYAEIAVSNFLYETIQGGYPKISNNFFNNYPNNGAAVHTNGGIISNNTIIGGFGGGIKTGNSEGGLILYNVIKDVYATAAITIGYDTSPTVIGNWLINNEQGITFWNPNATYVSNNTVIGSIQGFRFTEDVTASTLGTIIYNNIHSNSDNAVVEIHDPQAVINMTYNWWGTTDTSLIEERLYDQRLHSTLGLVNYEPFLTAPAGSPSSSGSTPSPTPSPTPAPTPEPTPTPTATPSPSPIPVPGQSFFFVNSNSTVSNLFFNSTSAELSFTVSGESETWGYVEVTISKTLVSSIQDVKVYLDGSPLSVAVTDDGDAWLLYFTYTHSTHDVLVSLAAAPEVGVESLLWLVSTVVVGVLFSVAIASVGKRKGSRGNGSVVRNLKEVGRC
jgi:hypothetical protein